MATVESSVLKPTDPAVFGQVPVESTVREPIPPLCAGDRLTRPEFERRYSAMPSMKKAELIEGVVYMPSPVSHKSHGRPHFILDGWVCMYWGATPGVDGGDNSTVRLDLENEPQPDVMLRILPHCGGQSRDEEDYVGGPPELVAEVAASSASYDLHDKLRATSATAFASIWYGGPGTRRLTGLSCGKDASSVYRSLRRANCGARSFPACGSTRRQ